MEDDFVKEVTKKTVILQLEDIGTKYVKPCKVCRKEFTVLELIAHEKTHPSNYDLAVLVNGDTKEYVCSICGERSPKETQLRIHQVQAHTASLVVYLEKTPLLIRQSHRRRLNFDKCEAEESKAVRIKRHKCRYCEKSFVLLSQCKSHENAHAETGVVCDAQFSSNHQLTQKPSEHPEQAPTSEVLPCNSQAEMETIATVNAPLVEPMQLEMPTLLSATSHDPLQIQFPETNGRFEQQTHDAILIPTEESFQAESSSMESEGNSTVILSDPNSATPANRSSASSEISYPCLTCGNVYTESQIFPHIKTHLKKGQKECSLCAYRAIASGDLRDHMSKHYNIKPYKCHLCPNAYAWQSGWKKHIGTHDKEKKPFRCSNCKLEFDTQRERRRHQLIHQNINGPSPKKKEKKRKKEAEYVSVTSQPQQQPQQQHQEGYTEKAQHQSQQNQFIQHQQQDALSYATQHFNGQGQELSFDEKNGFNNGHEEKLWDSSSQSQHGNATSSSKSKKKCHDKSAEIHDGSTTEKSDKIRSDFREPDDLRESELCKTCNQVIPMANLENHIRSHILPGQKACTICKYKCNTKVYLEEHYNIHYGLKPYICNLCNRRFAMRSYLRSHTQQVHESDTRRYQCRYCNKRFVRPCHQRTHEKIHEGQGETLPPGETGKVNTILDDSSSSSAAVSQTPGYTPLRRSSTVSNCSSASSRSHSYSSHSSGLVNNVMPKTDSQWGTNAPAVSQSGSIGNQQWSSSQWSANPTNLQYPPSPSPCDSHVSNSYDPNHWNSYYHSPLVKSDVNWTEPLSDASLWQLNHSQAQGQKPGQAFVKSEYAWGESSSSSSGFHSSSNSSNLPQSSSVQDLWTELHYEEMKWLPEAPTVYTADGIPMITEWKLDPFDDGSFSYTDMLNSATADLPLFAGGIIANDLAFPQDEHDVKPAAMNPQTVNENPLAVEFQIPPAKVKRKSGTKKAKKNSGVPEDRVISDTSRLNGEDSWEGGESLVSCKTCGVDIQERDLLAHIRAHLAPGQRTCDICQRTYCNPMTLKEHIHVHYNLKPHKCTYCSQRFSTKYSLKTHEVFTHEEGKASILQCPHDGCTKAFAMRNEFQKHLRGHELRNGTIKPPTTEKRKNDSVSSAADEDQSDAKVKEQWIKDAKSRKWEVRLLDIRHKEIADTEEIPTLTLVEHS